MDIIGLFPLQITGQTQRAVFPDTPFPVIGKIGSICIVAVNPPEDDEGNDSVQEICHELRPDQAVQSPDQIHLDHNRND